MINMEKDIEKKEVVKEKVEKDFTLTLEQQDKIYKYIYGIGEEYLKLLKEKNKYRLRKIFKYEIDIDIDNEINKVQIENDIEEKKIELKKYLKTLNTEESLGVIKEMIGYLYQSRYNELTYFTIETIVDIFLEKEIKISRENIENIVSINEEKPEKEKINLAEGLLKLLYVTEDESEEEKKKLGHKYIKNTWFNRYLEYLAIKELKKIRNNIDIQYRRQAVEEIIQSNSEYNKIYDLNGEQIIIGFVGYNIPKTIIENLNRILKEEILYFKNRNNIYTKKINMLYMERIVCIINIFETVKKVLEKSTNREQFLNDNINTNLKYNNISYVRITFIKKELDEKAKENLVRIFKDKDKVILKILGFEDESNNKSKLELEKLSKKERNKINAINSIKNKKKSLQSMKKKNDFEKILYANLLELEYMLLKKNNIIITKMNKGDDTKRHLELEYKNKKKDDEYKEIDDIEYYEKYETYDRITYILKDDEEEIGKIGKNTISEQQIINRIDIYARIIENIINENRNKKIKGNISMGIIEKLNMIGSSENSNKKIAKLLEYIFSEETKIINLSIKEKNKKLLEVIQKDGKQKTEQEIKKIKERYLKEDSNKRKRITYWDVEKFKLYKKAIEK
ncbi:MAG: hypothetical protein HXK70_05860 [Clostridiales bacterium]|nr:hypothetical protein [Clostridiales bacterium]